MTDHEVGELWCIYRKFGTAWPRSDGGEVLRLICKLIEERAKISLASICGYCAETGDTQRASETAIPNACRDFGIDPTEYEKAKP